MPLTGIDKTGTLNQRIQPRHLTICVRHIGGKFFQTNVHLDKVHIFLMIHYISINALGM